MTDDQRINSFEARIQQLEKQLANEKQKALTHEIMTGVLFTHLIRVVNKISPRQNAAQVLLDTLQGQQAKISDSDARNDPHTIDAIANAISAVNRALT